MKMIKFCLVYFSLYLILVGSRTIIFRRTNNNE